MTKNSIYLMRLLSFKLLGGNDSMSFALLLRNCGRQQIFQSRETFCSAPASSIGYEGPDVRIKFSFCKVKNDNRGKDREMVAKIPSLSRILHFYTQRRVKLSKE